MAISFSIGSGSGITRIGRRQRTSSWRNRRRLFRFTLLIIAFIAILPPIFFHFYLKRFHQIQLRKCKWLNDPPLVCAHGGDSSNAFPNTIKDLGAFYQHTHKMHDFSIPTIEEALMSISSSVQQVVLDAKVGPPSYENGLAKDILSVIERTHCKNCLVWAKSDSLARDIIRLSSDIKVGYIVMKDPSTGERTNILRMKGAKVVGVYHPLIDEKLMGILHRRDKKVYAWTVDDIDAMKKMLVEGVDAVVTSNPTLLGNVMQDIRTKCLEDGFSFSS